VGRCGCRLLAPGIPSQQPASLQPDRRNRDGLRRRGSNLRHAHELIPESALTVPKMAAWFALGAVAFFAGDWLVDHRGGADRKAIVGGEESGSGPSIFIGTLLDNVPESALLGMGLALGGAVNLAFLAAVFVSNLPEGMDGTVNLVGAGYPLRRIF